MAEKPVTITISLSPAQRILFWIIIDGLWETNEDTEERDLLNTVRVAIRAAKELPHG